LKELTWRKWTPHIFRHRPQIHWVRKNVFPTTSSFPGLPLLKQALADVLFHVIGMHKLILLKDLSYDHNNASTPSAFFFPITIRLIVTLCFWFQWEFLTQLNYIYSRWWIQ
jgi:hypothetical protein